MQTGVCRLCEQTGELHKSHFLPAAVYAQLRDDTERNPNPVLITDEVSLLSSRQIVEHLLCFDCEQRFSKLGETWVLKNMAREGSFPLQDALLNATALGASEKFAYFSGLAVPEIDMDALVYFALSVFWRGSAHRWKNVKGVMSGIKLGPFEEPIRLWLLGGAWPANISVQVAVWPTKEVVRLAYTPRRGRAPGYHCFNFMIPGIDFRLLTGSQLPDEVLDSCSYGSPQKYIYAAMQTVDETVQTIGKMMSTTRASKGLLARTASP